MANQYGDTPGRYFKEIERYIRYRHKNDKLACDLEFLIDSIKADPKLLNKAILDMEQHNKDSKAEQALVMASINNGRTKEDYARIVSKSAKNRDATAIANKRWKNADEASRKTNMDNARNKAYDNAKKKKEKRYEIILKWLPNDVWISSKEYVDKFKEEGLSEKYDIPPGFVGEVVTNRNYFKTNGNSNSRWIRFKKLAK